MRLSLPATLLAGCTAALLLQPAAPAAADPSGPQRHDFAGGGSTTSLPLPAGHGLAPRGTRPFELLGVGWDGPSDALAGAEVRVRTRDADTGRWSDWRRLEADGEDGPDHAPHGATAPLWTGRSDGVAVDVRPGPAGPPPGLRLDLVDPGPGAAAPAVRALPAEPPGPADGHRARRPAIVTRAGWGADESLREPGSVYTGPVRVVFVHHTATATDYACSDAPRVIRSIHRYHVRTSGWRDIGYNFLVDRCGTVYEGRAGGVDRPVHGAHTLGFNTDSAGVAAIGTYVGDQPPQPLLDGLAAVAAWKLGLGGRAADGRTTLTSGTDAGRYPRGTAVDFDAVSGHRDAFATECPGNALYARLPALRAAAVRLRPPAS
ncbi:peptidoglycan recognition protein [Kitasatospora sp. NPDC086791]|uniref:peptidoglycan recognition protein family protein n=1 Tax=Kitasatospora sp. NPDC086791 TaxID=3155178 RepID=UPI0034266575